jgi:hypothetical protein
MLQRIFSALFLAGLFWLTPNASDAASFDPELKWRTL